MRFNSEVIVHAVKESSGEFNGKPFSSCTFHCEVDLKENGAGRSIGRVTRPFKLGDAKEFDKWAQLGNSLPIKANAVFEMEAVKETKEGGGGTRLVLVEIKLVERATKTASAA